MKKLFDPKTFQHFRVDPQSREWIRFLKRGLFGKIPSGASKQSGVILAEIFPLPQAIIGISLFTQYLANRTGSTPVSLSFYTHSYPLFYVLFRKFLKIYKTFTRGHLHVHDVRKRFRSKEAEQAFLKAKESIRTKEDLLKLRIDNGFSIGVDIYETYLMEKQKPTAYLDDPQLYSLIHEFIVDYYFFKDYFVKNKVTALILSHGIYRYGFLSRLAARHEIPTYRAGIHFLNKLYCPDDPLKERKFVDFESYKKVFESLDPAEQKSGVELAKRQLERRFNAEVGVNMGFSTKSAFDRSTGKGRAMRESDKLKVLIASHCFFDNPFCYGWFLFSDFYDWFCFLGEMSNQTDYDWYVKTHRDYLPGNGPILEELLKKYPRLKMVDKDTSFHQLIDEGLSHVLTVYGTVGHELPYLGVTVVNAGYNPHSGYDFTVNPKTRDEYKNILLNLPHTRIQASREDLYRFYYVHYYCMGTINNLMVQDFYELEKKMGRAKESSTEYYTEFLKTLTPEKKNEIIDKWKWFLDSGAEWFANHLYEKSRRNKREVNTGELHV